MEDRELELSEHLEELRNRIIRCLIYIGVSSIVAWFFYDSIFDLLMGPVNEVLKQTHTKFLLTHLTEGFMIRCQVTLISGIILSFPLLTHEVWGFVSPALTNDERKPVKWIIPLCILLFAAGVAVAYIIFPAGMKFLIAMNPPESEFRPGVGNTITFVSQMFLAFGLVFELPVVLLFLGKLGIVDSQMLKSKWRYAVVGIAVIAAVITPSADAFSMTAMAAPLVILYFLSIILVRMVEKKPLK